MYSAHSVVSAPLPALVSSSVPEDTWIVVPAYNEATRIGPVLDGLLKLTSGVLVVDDASTDATFLEVSKRCVHVVRHGLNLGQGAALQTGIDFALSRNAQILVTFDSDGQHDPADIPKLISALSESKVDFALGSRFLGNAENIPASRKLVLRCGILFTRLLSGVSFTDTHNGLRAFTRRGAEHVRITMNRMEHASEILDQIADSGLRFVEVPVTVRYNAESLAKGQKSSHALNLGLNLLAELMKK